MKNSVQGVLAILAVLFFCPALMAGSGVYSWDDGEGVHFSDRAPPDRESQEVEVRQAELGNIRSNQQRASGVTNIALNGNSRLQEQQQLLEEQNEIKRLNCQIAKNNLIVYQNLGNKRIKGEDGQVKRLGEKDVAQRIDSVKRQINTYCQ